MASINRYNFIRWVQQTIQPGQPVGGLFSNEFAAGEFATGGPSQVILPVIAQNYDLPRAYERDSGRFPYMPVLVEGDVLSFYINTERGFNVGDFNGLGLRIIRTDGTIITSGFTPLYRDQITAENYNIYALFDVPELPTGVCHLQIFRVSDNASVLTSNPLLVRADDAVYNQTAVFRYRNDRYFYHTRYRNIPGFYQSVRLNVSVIDRQNETDKETYTEVTSGKQRTFNNMLRRYYRFETYYFDPLAHEAAAVMVEHDFLEINGLVFRHKTPYKETVDPLMSISKGDFEVYDEAFGAINRTTVPLSPVVGDGTGSALGDGNGNIIGIRTTP